MIKQNAEKDKPVKYWKERGSGTREVFENALGALDLTLPEPQWESISTAALVNAAQEGLGAAVVPYRMAAEDRIRARQCPRVCSNSVLVVETLVTASPEFFAGKKKDEIRAYFEHALSFL